jgi:propanol-preferring alcohol dehydrogenase
MKAMVLQRLGAIGQSSQPLDPVDLPSPSPGPTDVRLNVLACGVCHTELDEIEGRTPPPELPVVPGHEIIGRVECVGEKVAELKVGDRVGVGWVYSSCGGDQENLSDEFRATGRDANGGYAEQMVVPAASAFPIPDVFEDAQAAPLLCAGAIGYRALRFCQLSDGDPFGLTGFGGSAHLVLQLARYLYPNSEAYVFARDQQSRAFASDLGATWAGDTADRSPILLKAIIDTTPAWKPVVEAMKNLQPSGRLVINAIRKEDADKRSLLDLDYHEDLWMEKEIKSVANIARRDIRDFLPLAADAGIRPHVQTYRLDEANRALCELKHGSVRGAKVLVP